MSVDCLDIGIIQAFLDGELTPERSASVSGHIAACDACAAMLGEAEEESAFVFPVLERELSTLVPTQRLWARINDSIAIEKQNTPFWKKVLAGIAVTLRNPSITVAAGVVIIFGAFALFYSSVVNGPVEVPIQRDVALELPQLQPAVTSAPIANPVGSGTATSSLREPKGTVAEPSVIYQRTNYTRNVNPKAPPNGGPPVNADGYLPGEESYVKTIATLSDTVGNQKESVLKPSQQVAYERDLAVVDDSIKRMRKAVRNNPKNDSAKQVLYSSYQNKIDLLNSVAQKEELVASLDK